MKRRRIIWAGVAAAGSVVIILAFAGVFAPERPKDPQPERPTDVLPPVDEKTIGVVKDFQASGPEWSLRAPEARENTDGTTALKDPTVTVIRPMDKGEQRIVAHAREGRMIRQPQEQRELSGGVTAEFSGVYSGTLKTPSLTVDPAIGTGHTPDRMELVLKSDHGPHTLIGEGVDLDLKQRTVKIARNVTVTIAAPMFVISAEATRTSKSAKPPPIVITCDGPATADGFERAVRLQKAVVLRQGQDELHADRVNLFFAQTKSETAPRGDDVDGELELERFEAEGNVRFKTSVVDGEGTRLVRTRVNDQVILDGKPAVVRRAGNRIEAERIDLDSAREQVEVPMKGALHIEQEGDKPERIDIAWGRQFHLDPVTHEAVFRGGVVFDRSGMRVECQSLHAKLDAENRRPVSFRAEGDVRLSGTMPSEKGRPGEPVAARGREMTYDAQRDVVRLIGDASAAIGTQEARGADIEFGVRDSSLRVTGAGTLKARPQGADAAQEMQARWSGEMQYSRAAGKAVLRRDVSVLYGARKLEADEVTVRLAKDGSAEGLDAAGKVRMEDKGSLLSADRLTASLGAGNVLKDATATGRVVMEMPAVDKTPAQKLRADRVVAASGPDGTIQSMDATGHVVMERGKAGTPDALVLNADRVLASVGAKQELKSFDATGKVAIDLAGKDKDSGYTLRCSRVQSKPGNDGALEGFEATGDVVVEERVPAAKGGRVMHSDRATVALGADQKPRTVTAVGRRVTLEEDQVRAVGQELVWDVVTESGRLTGTPVEVFQGGNRLYGNLVEFSKSKGSIRIRGSQRVEATIVEGIPDLSNEPRKAAPSTPR